MSDSRYLKTSDYKKSILLSQLEQLTQGDDETLYDAELDAQACIESMLTDEYEIENEFLLGKSISSFSIEKEYPKGSYVVVDGRLSKTNSYVNPSRPPKAQDYWRIINSSELSEDFTAELYRQDKSYYVGDIVSYDNGLYFECIISNGVSSEYGEDSIVSPIPQIWEETLDGTNSSTFDITKKYIIGDVVEHNGEYYECIIDSSKDGLNIYPNTEFWVESQKTNWDSETDYSSFEPLGQIFAHLNINYELIDPSSAVVGQQPVDGLVWREIVIQHYDRGEDYVRGNGFDGYVVTDDELYYYVSPQDEQFINSASSLSPFLFSPTSDPRNRNIIKIMVDIVTYNLCSILVPDNVPTVRDINYRNSIDKLEKFSTMKANPSIDRKKFTYTVTDRVSGVEVEKTRNASRWAVNDSDVTDSTWDY